MCCHSDDSCDASWTCCNSAGDSIEYECGDCTDYSFACCEKSGGIYTGGCSDVLPGLCQGTSLESIDVANCDSSPCAIGACCGGISGDGTCVDTIQYECDLVLFGNWKGAGVLCDTLTDDAECFKQGSQTGACCINEEPWCYITDTDTCSRNSGTYNGDNTTCDLYPDCYPPDDCIVCTRQVYNEDHSRLINGIAYTNITLPSGDCLWMQCLPPNCPYSVCNE